MERIKNFPDDIPDETQKRRQELRAHHKRIRDALQEEDIRKKSDKICERLLESEWYEKSQVIYGYYPLGKEVDCRRFLAQALCDGKTVALPATSRTRLEVEHDLFGMEFFRITSMTELTEGAFHVMEPTESCPMIRAEDAIVIVPGVVFDCEGNRLGYGRGYYDRYFARYSRLHRIAVAYEQQMEEKLAVLSTDIRMHRIYTEEQEYRIG